MRIIIRAGIVVWAAIALVIAASACVPGETIEGGAGGTAVNYVHDDVHHVSCWVYSGGSISCLPDAQVFLP